MKIPSNIFGRTGLDITKLGYGAMEVRGTRTNIVGTKSVAHLLENVAAAALGPLSAEIYAEAKKRLAEAAN
jgi:aryl-alcohol dehydrogenase-like predicted oxidoreductase